MHKPKPVTDAEFFAELDAKKHDFDWISVTRGNPAEACSEWLKNMGLSLNIVAPDGTRYSSIEDAAEAYGLSKTAVALYCYHKRLGWSFWIKLDA